MNKGLSYDVYLSKLTKKCYDKDLVNYKFVKTTVGTSHYVEHLTVFEDKIYFVNIYLYL